MAFQAPVNLTEMARSAGMSLVVFVTRDVYDRALQGPTGDNQSLDMIWALRHAYDQAQAWTFTFAFFRRGHGQVEKIWLSVTHPTPGSVLVTFQR